MRCGRSLEAKGFAHQIRAHCKASAPMASSERPALDTVERMGDEIVVDQLKALVSPSRNAVCKLALGSPSSRTAVLQSIRVFSSQPSVRFAVRA